MADIARARANNKVGESTQWWAGRCETELEDFIRNEIKEAINLGLYKVRVYLGKHPSPVMDYLNATGSMTEISSLYATSSI